jgi:hypothetical protein
MAARGPKAPVNEATIRSRCHMPRCATTLTRKSIESSHSNRSHIASKDVLATRDPPVGKGIDFIDASHDPLKTGRAYFEVPPLESPALPVRFDGWITRFNDVRRKPFAEG